MPTREGPARWAGPSSYSSLAQSVEHAAVNRRVVGSSPTGGAILTRMPPLPQVAAYVNQKVTGVGL